MQGYPIRINRVVEGVLYLIAAIILMAFVSTNLTTEKQRYVLFFRDSIAGLKVGSAVMFQGVEVGTVKKIQLLRDDNNSGILVAVIIDFERGKFGHLEINESLENDQKGNDYNFSEELRDLMRFGLRAQLISKDQFTGELMIQFDFHPETAINLHGVNYRDYQEIPTIPSSEQLFNRTLEKIDLDQLFGALLRAIDAIERSAETENADNKIEPILLNTNQLLIDIKAKLDKNRPR